MGKIINAIDRINNTAGMVFKWALFVMTCSLTIEVVMRYFFGSPTRWCTDVCEQCVILLGAFGGAYSYLNDAFVRVDIIYERVSLRGKAIMDLCTIPVIALFTIMVTWQNIVFAKTSWALQEKSVTVLNVPYYLSKTAIAVGSVLLLVQAFSVCLKNIYVVKNNKPYPSVTGKGGLN